MCTALSYGSSYEAVETRCDGVDNDCDGVTDPATWSPVTPLAYPLLKNQVSSLRVAGGVLAAVFDRPVGARIVRMDTSMKQVDGTNVPVDVLDTSESVGTVRSQLLSTSRGPALYYSSTGVMADHTRGHLIPLDAQGRPVLGKDGSAVDVVLFDHPVGGVASDAAVAAGGSQVFVAWANGPYGPGAHEVLGTVTDLDGKVLAAPRVLMRMAPEGAIVDHVEVLGLSDGSFLLAVLQETGGLGDELVRLQRFDSDLLPVGDERTVHTVYSPTLQLVELGASPALLVRDTRNDDKLAVVKNLFDGGTQETVAVTTLDETAWFGATATSHGLEVAWLSVRSAGASGGDIEFNWRGRFWALGQKGAPKDWTPGAAPLPLHRFAEWVLLEELPERWMGALVMTSTQTPRTHVIQAVRYCSAPNPTP
ncbi:hypothetical protein D7V97_24580 [Corallococcus sp. CA053C]|nr:hypothetical protein D7V97_24580 [Corallococcus sp. CA053C]